MLGICLENTRTRLCELMMDVLDGGGIEQVVCLDGRIRYAARRKSNGE